MNNENKKTTTKSTKSTTKKTTKAKPKQKTRKQLVMELRKKQDEIIVDHGPGRPEVPAELFP